MKKLLIIFLFLGTSLSASAIGVHKVYQLKGTAVGEMRQIADYTGDGEPDEALCFDVDLIDLKLNRKVGTATDCLANIEGRDHGLQLLGTTIFKVKRGLFRGEITTRGITSVSNSNGGSPSTTHFTGSIPAEDDNSVVEAKGWFRGLKGTARLAGAVDMSNMTEGHPEITFDCLFVLNLKY